MATPTTLDVLFADGTTERVTTTLEDRLNFESTLRKNKGWGKLEDNQLKLIPFLAWSALRRNNKTELTWAEFTSGDTAALSVEPVKEDEEDGDEDEKELEVEGLGKDTQTAPSTSSPWSSPETTAAPLGSGDPVTPAHG